MNDRSHRWLWRGGVLFGLAMAALALSSCDVELVLVVTTTDDTVDSSPGDGICDDGTGGCSLRAAVQEANATTGVVVIELTADETYTLALAGPDEDLAATGDLDVTGAVVLHGDGATIDAAGLDRALDTRETGSLATHNVTITGGEVRESSGDAPHGGGIRSLGNLALIDTTVTANAVHGDVSGTPAIAGGGGVYGTEVTIQSSDVSHNLATKDGAPGDVHESGAMGGGLWATRWARIAASTITQNTASSPVAAGGGGMTVESFDEGAPPSWLELTDSVVEGNRADTRGEATSAAGGGVFADDATVTDSTISTNEVDPAAFGLAGGIGTGGDLDLTDSTVAGNRAPYGAGILSYWGIDGAGGHLELARSTVDDNIGHDGGGVVVLSSPNGNVTATIRDSTIAGNESSDGGGLTVSLSPSVVVSSTTLSGNRSWVDGGCCTGAGGAIVANQSTVHLVASTVTANHSEGGAAIALDGASTLHLAGSVVGAQTIGGDCGGSANSGDGTFMSDGHNLDSDGTCGLTQPTDLEGVDPLLGPLADNGGPTLTHLPLAGSPLRDAIPVGAAGLCDGTVPADQRGVARPQSGACDIGPVEQ